MQPSGERRQSEEVPACFSALRFYRNWREQQERCVKWAVGEKATSICEDCLPSYALAMRRAGRCSNPSVTWRVEDGAIVGCG